jgi:hypothetical protein
VTPGSAGVTVLRPPRNLFPGSLTGIGRQTATTVLAEPPVAHFARAESAAAYCGLAPREFTSGKSVRKRTRLSKAGNARLRTALYLPTLTAIRFNSVLRRFFDRLVAAGKPRMQAVGACMRKLVMVCFEVLKNRMPFDPEWASQITASLPIYSPMRSRAGTRRGWRSHGRCTEGRSNRGAVSGRGEGRARGGGAAAPSIHSDNN